MTTNSQTSITVADATFLMNHDVLQFVDSATGNTEYVQISADPSSGTGITVRISGFKVYETFTVAYGAPALTIPFKGNLIIVLGTGAVIELLADTEHVVTSPVVLTPGTVSVGNVVETDFGQSTDPASIVAAGSSTAGATGALATALQTVSGTPMLAVSLQDPTQVAVSGGKASPVKVET